MMDFKKCFIKVHELTIMQSCLKDSENETYRILMKYAGVNYK